MTSICRACGKHTDNPARRMPGHFAIELLLWACLLVPGLIYTIWRFRSIRDCCPACGSEDLIPADSPLGRQMTEQARAAEPREIEPRRLPSKTAYGVGRALGRLFR